MGRTLSKNHPAQMFLMLWRHYDLILQLVKRDILMRYRGSFAGVLWLILAPLLMLGLYTLVFSVFMRIQWPGVTNNLMYSLLIYVGLIILNFFGECMNRSPTMIVSNANFVKKVVFPVEIYPWIIIGSALFHAIVNTFILALFCFFILGKVNGTILLLPILFIPLILFSLGMSWFLCSAGVYVRDITHMMVFILQVIMYLSPVFYSISMLPELFQKILFLNPLTCIIEQARSLVIFGKLPQWESLGIFFIVSVCIAYIGFLGFQKTKDGFADVL
ncbi:ABC transporter of LPS O-antigen, Wzm [Legionella gratiana]|uniref:Transport permease protein n=1 Tax=Legionella gratiana TaxID=45066 RepID=A0A378JFP7_9GAMM|nr:ABC transporter permease [Legionella gratiana]KTD12107.1 ABC transporter of LPS O-antigen, Wzm [Legionella gratiana]STX46289.1 lipopolysaccharide transport system permease [Legionella gratiana]